MTDRPNARTLLRDELRTRIPADWRIIDWQDDIDVLDSITVAISVTHLQPADAAPIGAYDTTVTLSLISPKSDNMRAAEGQLEDALGEFLPALEDLVGATWETARKAIYADRYLCWDVPVHVLQTRSLTPDPEPAPAPVIIA